MRQSINCVKCGNVFKQINGKQKYCSKAYSDFSRPPGNVSLGSGKGLTTSAIGAIGELIVTANLLERGYFVFRNVAPSGPCDIIAFRRGEPAFKIEVKVSNVGPNTGRISHPSLLPTHEYDTVALVLPDMRVLYRPPLRPEDPTT